MSDSGPHSFAFSVLRFLRHVPGAHALARLFYVYKHPSLETELFGLKFRNPIGVASGLDRKGEYYNDLAIFGPGYVEIGPARNTSRIVRNLMNCPPRDIVSVIVLGGLHSDSYGPELEKDFALVYDFADVVALALPLVGYEEIIDRAMTVRRYNEAYRPIMVKISEQMPASDIEEVVRYSLLAGVDAIETSELHLDAVLSIARDIVPVVAEADVSSLPHAAALLSKGVSLISLSTGLVKNGPSFVKHILKSLTVK